MTTYSAIQSIKYSLQSRQPLAKNRSVSMFSRKDRLYSPIDSKLTRNMRKAYKLNNIEQDKKSDELQKRKEFFEIDTNKFVTGSKLKENNSANAEAAKLEHAKILQLAYTPKKTRCRRFIRNRIEEEVSDEDSQAKLFPWKVHQI